MVDLKAKPFFLDDEGIKWVEDVISSMSIEEKIGQLFFPVGFTKDRDVLKSLLAKGISGIMYRAGPGAKYRTSTVSCRQIPKFRCSLPPTLKRGA